MKSNLRLIAVFLALFMSRPLCAETVGDANIAAKSDGSQASGFPAASSENPTPSGPSPVSAPPPINDPSKGSSQGDPGNRVPLLAPPPGSTPGMAGSSGTVAGDNASGGR